MKRLIERLVERCKGASYDTTRIEGSYQSAVFKRLDQESPLEIQPLAKHSGRLMFSRWYFITQTNGISRMIQIVWYQPDGINLIVSVWYPQRCKWPKQEPEKSLRPSQSNKMSHDLCESQFVLRLPILLTLDQTGERYCTSS